MTYTQTLPSSTINSIADTCDEKKLEEMKAAAYNSSSGSLHLKDGYNCPLCKNRGDIARLLEYPPGCWQWATTPCKCRAIRSSLQLMQQSGLGDVMTKYSFSTYDTPCIWQSALKAMALEYVSQAQGWFYLGGQSGAGKTHLCTAICRELLMSGRRTTYMIWPSDSIILKRWDSDWTERQSLIHRLKTYDVLYIDDFLRTAKGADGAQKKPSSADLGVAFDLLNHRYLNRDQLTIISCEWSVEDILSYDKAVGGRIIERVGRYSFCLDGSDGRNWRMK